MNAIPMILHCPLCNCRHIDQGLFATKEHHTHACQKCGHVWRPAIVATVGVSHLPGFRDYDAAEGEDHCKAPSITIASLIYESYDRAKRKGFYSPPPSIDSRLCLIHSEVSEALEDYRDDLMVTTIDEKGKPRGFPSEMADIMIRVADLAGYLKIDLDREIRIKSDYNETRPLKHGRVRL